MLFIKNLFLRFLTVVVTVTILTSTAYAEDCTEYRCVDGQCETIPRPDLPGCDHPDDNFSVSNFLLPKSGFNYQYPDLVTFLNGYHESFSLLADRVRKGEAFTDLGTFAGDLLGSSRLLVVPSGGLKGLGNSAIFKAMLDEFVKNGGVLVVMGQQHGTDFSPIPTPDGKPLQGYGWSEDQACLWGGIYLDTYHQVLASVTTQYASANVDGYFTSYPANSTTLLRRTSNNLPAMLMYDYGLGKVIVSSFYSDWGYTQSQATGDEIAIIRDLLSWAKQPTNLPEYRPGGQAELTVVLSNGTSLAAAKAGVTLYNPDRSQKLLEKTIDLAVVPGESVTTPVNYQIDASAMLGIYHIDYVLYDAQGNVVQTQTEADSGRFVVSNPVKPVEVKKDIFFSVSTPSQDVFYQDTFDYTFHIFNNSTQERNLRVVNRFRHTGREYQWQVTAKPNGETSLSGSAQFIDSRWMFETMESHLYDENGKEVGIYELSFKGLYPSVQSTIKPEKQEYAPGETVQLSTMLKNSNTAALSGTLHIKVLDPAFKEIFTADRNFTAAAGGTSTVGASFTLPQAMLHGSYSAIVEAYDLKGTRIGGNATNFMFPYAETSIIQLFPSSYAAGSKPFSLSISNIGKIPIADGKLELSVKDPDGGVVPALPQSFVLPVGQSKQLDMPVMLPQGKLGTYFIYYRASDETRTGTVVTVPFVNSLAIDFTPDKLTSRIRETAGASVTLRNTGRFLIENATVTVTVADAGFTDTRTFTIGAGQNQEMHYQIPIPTTMAAGAHDVLINVNLPSRSSLTKTSFIAVAPAILSANYAGAATLSSGDSISLTVENTGGVDAAYVTEKLALTDASGNVIFQGSASGTLLAGGKKELLNFTIPAQAATGPVVLDVVLKNPTTSSLFSMSKNLTLTGVEAALTTRTDKPAYLQTESITALSPITTSALGLDGALLDLTVNRFGAPGGDIFKRFLPQQGYAYFADNPTEIAISPDGSIYVIEGSWSGYGLVWKYDRNMELVGQVGQRGDPNKVDSQPGKYLHPVAVGVGPDGSVYVADDTLCRVLKYDREGNLLKQISSYCLNTGPFPDGQFGTPSGLTVAADGSVYVADVKAGRIQKFDANLNFLLKWGSLGSPTGQFNYLHGLGVGPDGSVYVADTYNNRIQRFTPDGAFISAWGSYGTADGQLANPLGVTVAADGAVFVTDSNNSRIQKFDSTGKFIAKVGSKGNGTEQFNYPQGIVVNSDGAIYVADTSNKRIKKLDTNMNTTGVWGSAGSGDGQFNYPYGIALASDGSKYVADKDNHRIQKFDRNGTFVTKWGSNGTGNGQFKYPVGVASGPDGAVYVADYGNNRIQKFDADGKFVATWGTRGIGDGQFYNLRKVVVSPDNFLYVLDDRDYIGNARIQKFDKDGRFIAKTGSLTNFYSCNDLSIGPDGNIYVATSNNPLLKFDRDCNYLGNIVGPYYQSTIAVAPDNSIYVFNGYNGFIEKWDTNGKKLASYGSVEGPFPYSYGMAVDTDGTVYLANTDKHCIQRMMISTGLETLFHTTLPVSQSASAIQEYSAAIGTLSKTGKMYLGAQLKNGLGQLLAKAEYPFYVVQGNTMLTAALDKKMYRPGEAVTISGELKNLSSLNMTGVTVSIAQIVGGSSQPLYSATVSVPANGSYYFNITTVAGAVASYTITGTASQNGTVLVDVGDQYEVITPKVAAIVTAPDVAGRDPFTVNVMLKNAGNADAIVTVTPSFATGARDVAIPAGESRLVQFDRQISSDTTDVFVFSGDLNQSLTRTVKYGLVAGLAITPQPVYLEGSVAVPVIPSNSGLLDGEFSFAFNLLQGNQVLSSQNRQYALAKGASASDTLVFDLAEGSYSLTASSTSPATSATASLVVRKGIKMDMAMVLGSPTGGLQPVSVNVTNLGYYPFAGTTRLTLVSGDGSLVWSGAQEVVLPFAPNPTAQPFSFTIDVSSIKPGGYTMRGILVDGADRQLAIREQPFSVLGPLFVLTQIPPYRTFQPGEEASFVFKVQNKGTQEGAFDFTFKADDLNSSTRTEWLKQGEEKELAFVATMPVDLEEKDYYANYALASQGATSESGTVAYHLKGTNLTVTAALDKQAYRPGDDAIVTLNVSEDSQAAQQLVARINYNGFEVKQPFTLSGSQTLALKMPLARVTGEKLFYGIYQESGRSLHLNSLYLYPATASISITTDRQTYYPGEQVTVLISGNGRGSLTLTGPGDFNTTFDYAGATTREFTLPVLMAAGTKMISYKFTDGGSGVISNGTYLFDVTGLQVKIKESSLDKGKYAATDTIRLSLNMESNVDWPATIKTWVIDPEGNPTPAGTSSVVLNSAKPAVATLEASLKTGSMGIHRLLYGIYFDNLLVSSGSEAFDVGSAVLLALGTDLSEYPTLAAPVAAKAALYGSGSAVIEYFLDGKSVRKESIDLAGFLTHSITLAPASVAPGSQKLMAVLTSDGLLSTREVSFTYGGTLPDLSVQLGSDGVKGTKIGFSLAIANQGKTQAAATTVSLYDGDPVKGVTPFTTLNVPSLAAGESTTLSYDWSVLGQGGDHTIYALVDAAGLVTELVETNNSAVSFISLPAVTMALSTGETSFSANTVVGVNLSLANLSSSSLFHDLVQSLHLTGPSGTLFEFPDAPVNSLPPSTELATVIGWNTASSLPGNYSVSARLVSGDTLMAVAGGNFIIEPTASLTGVFANKDSVIQGLPLDIAYTVLNNGNIFLTDGVLTAELVESGSGVTASTYTSAIAPLAVLQNGSQKLSIDKVDVQPADYKLRFTAEVAGIAIPLGENPLKVLPPVDISKAISSQARVLVLLEKQTGAADSDQAYQEEKRQAVAETTLRQALGGSGAYYDIARSGDEFKARLRSGLYNCYLLAGGNLVPEHLGAELEERVNSGDGLIVFNYKMLTDDGYLGTAGEGDGNLLAKPRLLTLRESPVSKGGSYQISGWAQKLRTISSNAQVAAVLDDAGKSFPALVLNPFGKGKVAVFAFTPDAGLLESAVRYLTQTEVDVIPGAPLPVQVNLKSLGAQFDLQVAEAFDAALPILLSYPSGRIDEQEITWQFSLPSNGSTTISYLIKLPEESGTFTLNSKVSYLRNGSYETYETYPLAIESVRGLLDMKTDILAKLQSLVVERQDANSLRKITDEYVNFMNIDVTTTVRGDEAINELLQVIGDLRKLPLETAPIRLEMDQLLKVYERKWSDAQSNP